MFNEDFVREVESKKRLALAFGSAFTAALWVGVAFRRNLRSVASLATLHLVYQLIKEFEGPIMGNNAISWTYISILTSSELLKFGPFYEYATVSPILLIRQSNPYLDVFFGKKTAVVRLVVMLISYRYFKSYFQSVKVEVEKKE